MKYRIKCVSCIVITAIILLNIQSCFSFSKNRLINYIQMNQIWAQTDEYGGFKNSAIDENASIEITAEAMICLSELQVVNHSINDGAISYISGCEQFEGGFSVD